MTSTSFDLEGYRVSRTLGVVRGIIVRSRSVFGTIGAGLQTLIGGNITLLTDLCERTREESFNLMLQHEIERFFSGPFAEIGQESDIPADQRLQSGSDRAEHRPGANNNSAHHSERSRHPVSLQ